MIKRISLAIFIVCFISVVIFEIGAQPLDTIRQFPWQTPSGMPGNVTGDLGGIGVVNIQDALMCAQYYVGNQKVLPFYRSPSAWYEIHVPFTEMTQETFHNMVYVDKDAALESVKAFEIVFNSENNNEEGVIWIDDVAIYRDNPTGYREYYTIGNYDELTAGGPWFGGRYFVFNDGALYPNPSKTYGEVVAGGPSGRGNCLKVLYDLGSHFGPIEYDTKSIGVGLDIIYGNPYTPAEVPMGTYLVADVRTFNGIRFWIKIQKCGIAWSDGDPNVGTIDLTDLDGGVGDEPVPIAGLNLGSYVLRCRLKSADEVISDPHHFNYFGLNIDY